MKNLEELTDLAIEIINECCNHPEFTLIDRPLKVNYRARSRWGLCTTYNHGTCSKIEISSLILADDVPDEKTLSTIVHELLHAVKGAAKDGHRGIWKTYADRINKLYPDLEISRCTSAEFFGIDEKTFENKTDFHKYAIGCENCSMIHYSSKLSKTIKHPNLYKCGCCGGKLIRLK